MLLCYVFRYATKNTYLFIGKQPPPHSLTTDISMKKTLQYLSCIVLLVVMSACATDDSADVVPVDTAEVETSTVEPMVADTMAVDTTMADTTAAGADQ